MLETEPESDVAAYNLGILLARGNLEEAIRWLWKAFRLRPSGKYGLGLAFYLRQKGDAEAAMAVLRETIGSEPRAALTRISFWPTFTASRTDPPRRRPFCRLSGISRGAESHADLKATAPE